MTMFTNRSSQEVSKNKLNPKQQEKHEKDLLEKEVVKVIKQQSFMDQIKSSCVQSYL